MRVATLFLFLGWCGAACAQSFDWAWAWAAGGSAEDRAVVDVSSTGAVHVLGTFTGTTDAHGVALTSAGETDVFVQHVDPTDGSVLWTAEAHNTADMEVFDVAYRSTGELVVCGYVYHDGGTATFGTHTIAPLASGNQAFIAGLYPTGSWNWVSVVPGPLSSIGQLVEVDAADDILLQCGLQRVWVYKFTGAGVPVWEATASSDQGSLDGYAMDVLPDGGLVITGRFYDTGTFGTTELYDATNYYDAFIAKLNANGTWAWARQAGGSHWDKGFGVQATAAGDVYVLGTFRNLATFGPDTYQAVGTNDIWVAKLNGNGDWLWTNPAGSTAYMEVYGTDLSADGTHIALVGTYALEAATIDGLQLPDPPTNSNDIYVAELDTLGTFTSVKTFGSLLGDQGLAVAYDPDGHVYAAGSFQGDMLLDAFALDNISSNDLWVGRLDPDLVTALAPTAATRGTVQVYPVDDELLVHNGTEQPGTLTLFDALGRPLASARTSAGARLRLPLPVAAGLVCWRHVSAAGSVVSGTFVR